MPSHSTCLSVIVPDQAFWGPFPLGRVRIFSSFPGVAITFNLICSCRLSGSEVKPTLIFITFFSLRHMVIFTMIINILGAIHVKFL